MYLRVIMRALAMKVISSIQDNNGVHPRAPEFLDCVRWEDALTSVVQGPRIDQSVAIYACFSQSFHC